MPTSTPFSLTAPGHFVLGANYWASHAGTAMWRNWRPEVVEADFARLAAAGLQVLRVFPLWPDFQPLHLLRTYAGNPVEFRQGEEAWPEDEAGQAAVSPEAVAHFETLADLAERYGLRLIVGLLTGWMSGRLFVPPALEGLNVLTDPRAVLWEVRWVRYFVQRLRTHPAIAAWDLGNECNCMGQATREEAWVWTATIVNAIRASDPTRPIVSGMHSLSVDPSGAWSITDQSELTDLLTTHPYPIFTPHCDQDPVNTIRTGLHATAESRLYADVGGKPCLAEEIGTLGPVVASERIAADFTRASLFSLWAHDCHGFVWWCANDQVHLPHAPYDWHAVERELGLFRQDGSAKPLVQELSTFRRFLDGFPGQAGLRDAALPVRTTEAVCILSDGQDQWGTAYSAFVLAKQAGFDLEFQYETQPLKEASLYLVPCITGHRVIHRRRWLELLERVRAGATLYLSHQNGFLSSFEEVTGLEVQTRERRAGPASITLHGLGEPLTWTTTGTHRLTLKPTRAQVLGCEMDGNPALTCAPYGQGQVYFLSFPLELELTARPGAFHAPDAPPAWRLYRHIAAEALAQRVAHKQLPFLGLTEHPLGEGRRLLIAINYSSTRLEETLRLAKGWRVERCLYGAYVGPADMPQITLSANDALVVLLQQDEG